MKKNFIFPLSTLVVLSLVLLFSCQANNDELKPAELTAEQTSYLATIDKIGQKHNAALDYLASKVDLLNHTDEEAYETIKEYYISTAATPEIAADLEQVSINDCGCKTNSESFKAWAEENNLPASENKYLMDIHNLLQAATNMEIEELLAAIRVIEKNILNENASIDKQRLLGTTSILRNSVQYWHEAFYNDAHPYHERMILRASQAQGGDKLIPWYLLYVAMVDALAYDSCMGNPNQSQDPTDRCQNQGAYASSRA